MFVSLSAFTWFEVLKASRAGFGPFMEVWFIVSFKQLVKLSLAILPQLAWRRHATGGRALLVGFQEWHLVVRFVLETRWVEP